jgi:p-cumate 2,3-dioxygenase alpha subunit
VRVDPAKIASGLINRSFYTSADIYHEEQERIFGHSWLFVAHRSEFRKPGDFKTLDLANQPALAVLGDDGNVRVFLNTCSHRGTLVETNARGNRKSFRCMYHHWEYDLHGSLTVVPRAEGYGPGFRREQHGLMEFPNVATYRGIIFASLSKHALALSDYLGDAAPYLDYLETGGGELEVLGCYDFLYEGNWNMLYENTLDDYHAQYLHAEAYRMPEYATGQAYAAQGSRSDKRGEPPNRAPKGVGIHSVLDWLDAPDTLHVQTVRQRHLHVAIFPTFLGLYHPGWDVTNYRILRPEGIELTRVHNYVLGPANMDRAGKRAIAERFHNSYGPGGRVGLDDVRVLRHLQRGLRANAQDVLMTRGMHRSEGIAADEHNVRTFWNTWSSLMTEPARHAADHE